jgi:hypothetical protein
MIVEITPTSVLFELTFLISCIGHPDVMGSKPKRLIYVTEGLSNVDYAYTSTAAQLTRPSDIRLSNIIAIKREIRAVQAELLLDLAGLHIFTASFTAAEEVSYVRDPGPSTTLTMTCTDFEFGHFPYTQSRPVRHLRSTNLLTTRPKISYARKAKGGYHVLRGMSIHQQPRKRNRIGCESQLALYLRG